MQNQHEGAAMGDRILRLFASSLLAIVALVLAGADGPRRPAPANSSKSLPTPVVTGRLNIEGQGIERIVLAKRVEKNGTPRSVDPNDTVVLHRPGPSESVPAGEYWIWEVRLTGGYSHFLLQWFTEGATGKDHEGKWLTISPEKPCLLKIGGPLKPGLSAGRKGRLVSLGYYVIDAVGRKYEGHERNKPPPQFTVCCDGRAVDSYSFEYG